MLTRNLAQHGHELLERGLVESPSVVSEVSAMPAEVPLPTGVTLIAAAAASKVPIS